MEQFKLVKINTGNAVHLAKYFEAPTGYKGYDVYCGSGKTGVRPRLYDTHREVTLENISCKKCQKRYQEKMKDIMNYNFSYEEQLKYDGLTEFLNARLNEGYKVRNSSILCEGLYQVLLVGRFYSGDVQCFINLDYAKYDWDYEYIE